MRTCRRLGIRTVAVYSDADRDALHVACADEAIRIGPAPARDSYLQVDAIIEAAPASGAEAIHPGYGFLSEKPELAAAVRGGRADLRRPLRRMHRGDGAEDRRQADRRAGTACRACRAMPATIRSTRGCSPRRSAIGFPVMVKASAGGGGKGMRACSRRGRTAAGARPCPARGGGGLRRSGAADRKAGAAAAPSRSADRRRPARQSRPPVRARLLGPAQSTRSCSRKRPRRTSRRPCARSCSTRAVTLGKAIGYDNLGTVEFILEEGQDEPWFLEMNTRLQVEHPVTEAITGLRSRRMADPDRRGRAAAAAPGRDRPQAAMRSRRGSRPSAPTRASGPTPARSSAIASRRRSASTAASRRAREMTLFYDSLLARRSPAGTRARPRAHG